ncbi:MAG: LacI family DNA-binding transcriptional regulator [Anaerolineaceae bacterium]|nr:LacI family DNA-binding transcriptional regulator [Anaerolineaceae bacterium]MBN2677849.1 LacI family DNA-binding transcriptional regulator [Anaerolineaceae bacterium]
MGRTGKATIYEVAREAGVSRQTVSRVINNKPDVALDTRKRVLDIISDLEYQPSAIARSLSQRRSYNFGVLTAGLKYIGPSTTLSGITATAEELGYGLLLKELSSFSANNIHPILIWFLSHQVDGILWAAPEIGSNRDWINDMLDEIRVPIIFLTTEKRDDISIVTIDNYHGAKMATQHLLDLGRKQIGHIAGPLEWWEARQRLKGWQDAMRAAGLKTEKRMVVEGNWSSKSGKVAINQLLSAYPEMDGVFVGNDQMALSVLQAAFERGISIPEQLAVVGFDGIPESEYYCPSLTTICQNQHHLGSIAVQELVRLVDAVNLENQKVEPIHLAIKPELIIRRSSDPDISKGGD